MANLRPVSPPKMELGGGSQGSLPGGARRRQAAGVPQLPPPAGAPFAPLPTVQPHELLQSVQGGLQEGEEYHSLLTKLLSGGGGGVYGQT